MSESEREDDWGGCVGCRGGRLCETNAAEGVLGRGGAVFVNLVDFFFIKTSDKHIHTV